MIRKIALILSCAALLGLVSCSHVHCAENQARPPLKVVASTFPVWLFAANVIGDARGLELELLIPGAAGCPHDFALKPADLQKLASADALIINGAGLEEFLAKPLSALEKKPDIIDASVNVPMLDSVHDSHDHVNPHIFAAPGEACLMVRNIAAGLAALDEVNARTYAANASAYMEQLNAISQSLEKVGKNAKNRGIVLEHEGLAYLAANAGLSILSIIEPPVSPSQLANVESIIAENKPALLAGETQYPDRLLQTLSRQSGVPAARMNTCAGGPDNAPLDYYQQEMRKNLEILEEYFE